MNRDGQEAGGIRIETIELSDLFSLKEGRRPRLLMANLDTFQVKRLHEMAGFFADLGCNVDIAPNNGNLGDIQRQCLENDTDLLLLFSDEGGQHKEFHDFQTNIFSQMPHMKAALCTSDSKTTGDMQKNQHSWSFFDHNETPIIIASTLLKKLVYGN